MSASRGRVIGVKKAECVEANPRWVMAVVAIGMIVGALLSPGKPSASAGTPASSAAAAAAEVGN